MTVSETTKKTQVTAAAQGAVGSLPAPDEKLLAALEATGAALGLRATDRLAAAHDASHYLLTPQVVVRPDDVTEVGRVLAACRAARVPVTFRSGGTSLSGQSVTDAVLVDTRRGFRSVEVLDDGARVRTGPGSTVRAVNARLMPHGTKLGPDPASEIACTIGGVVANNSSGMACGIEANTYRTLDSAVLVLPSGTVVDTGAEDADARLQAGEPRIHAGLLRLRERIRRNPDSVEQLRRLHAIKNTMGYGLNSFLDHDRPVDILEHLVIGSEGTLAFLAEATFRTVPVRPCTSTGLLIFPGLADAARALPALVDAGFATVELMDAASLRVAQQDPQVPADLAELDVVGHAALLVELQESDAQTLAARVASAEPVLAGLALADGGPGSGSAQAPLLSEDPGRRAALWSIRKGLFTAVAGSRPSGTTALLEDIAVPVERLDRTCAELIALFDAHGYEDAVIFGHAKDGNIHFMITDRFDDDGGTLPRYEAFTEDMVDLVLRHGGTLKAEHGTGRIMAPFVRRQVGDELFAVMQEVRSLIDPEGLLNPGVLLTEDPKAHLRDLKTTPTVEEEVDRCVECGYCEPVCPSRDLTTTPRERIVLRREIARAEARGDEALAGRLREEHRYDVVDTCAADGMCQTACPVLINTGDLVRRLRAEEAQPMEQAVGRAAAAGWGAVGTAAGLALSSARRVPPVVPQAASDVARAVLGKDRVPRWTPDLPGGGTARPRLRSPDAQAVFFAGCTGTMFGPAGQPPASDVSAPGRRVDGGVAAAMVRLSAAAGVGLRTPAALPHLCCGTPWKSKGLTEGYETMRARVVRALESATDGGRLPVVSDASSCTEGLQLIAEQAGFTVRDAVEHVALEVLPRLEIPAARRCGRLVLHPTCSSDRLGIDAALRTLAEAVADEVLVPQDWGCCAFAGDRGMLHPELTASATRAEAAEVLAAGADVHASLNRTCELAMTRATGKPYRHILEVLDEVVGPR